MTALLEKAFHEAARLSEAQQNALANWLLAELRSEKAWERAFEESGDQLAALADEALREHAEGRTRELDPERL